MHCYILCDINNKTFSIGKSFSSDQFDLAVNTFKSDVDVKVNTLYPEYVVNSVLVENKPVWGLSYSISLCPTINSLFGWKEDKLVFLWSYTENSLVSVDEIPENMYLYFDTGEEVSLQYVK